MKVRFVVGTYRGDLQTLGAENERGGRYAVGRGTARKLEMRFRIGSRKQLPLRVIHLQLDAESAQCRIQCAGRPHEGSCISLAGMPIETQLNLDARLCFRSVGLRHIDVDAQLLCVGYAEQGVAE